MLKSEAILSPHLYRYVSGLNLPSLRYGTFPINPGVWNNFCFNCLEFVPSTSVNFLHYGEPTKKLANFDQSAKEVKKFRQKATQKQIVNFFEIATISDKVALEFKFPSSM